MMSFMMQAARALIALPLLLPSCQSPDADVALGVLAGDRVALTATANEIITDLPVAEGQGVTVGTVLVQLDDRLAKASLDLALANLAQAQADPERMQTGARAEDIRIAEAKLSAAEAQVAAERILLQNLTIVASRDGTLDNLPWTLGERILKGSQVAILLTGPQPFARVYVPAPIRPRLKISSPVQVKVDGIAEAFMGTVRWINSEPAFTPYYALNREQRSRLVYLTEIDLPPEAGGLPVGLPVTAYLP